MAEYDNESHLLDEMAEWFESNADTGRWGDMGNIDLENDVSLCTALNRYDEMLQDMATITLPGKPESSLGYSQVEIINVIIKLLIPLLFKHHYDTNHEIILSMLRCITPLPYGVVLVLSRRCGKSTIIAHISITVCKYFGNNIFQLFARTRDQASVIAQLAGNLVRDSDGKLPPQYKATRNSVSVGSGEGGISRLRANPATDVSLSHTHTL